MLKRRTESNTLTQELVDRRTQSGLSLEAIESSTKISRIFLRAIEDQDFSRLPGGLYNRTYIRQYARQIGFDEDRLLQQYHMWTESREPAEGSGSRQFSWIQNLLPRRH